MAIKPVTFPKVKEPAMVLVRQGDVASNSDPLLEAAAHLVFTQEDYDLIKDTPVTQWEKTLQERVFHTRSTQREALIPSIMKQLQSIQGRVVSNVPVSTISYPELKLPPKNRFVQTALQLLRR
jgi:hypothetical protein